VLSGTWKAYCDIGPFGDAREKDDTGVFTLWMEPGGSTFIGTFYGDNPDTLKNKAEGCPSANGNWAGRRAAA
jgi:hypothetical protein